jgi:hypothetical protein
MAMSPILEEVKPETAAMIASQAKAKGLSVDDYLKSLIGMISGPESRSLPTLTELDVDLEAFAEGTDHLPPTTLTYSREDIYFDHD